MKRHTRLMIVLSAVAFVVTLASQQQPSPLLGAQFHWYDGADRFTARVTDVDRNTKPPTLVFTENGSNQHLTLPGGVIIAYHDPSSPHPADMLAEHGIKPEDITPAYGLPGTYLLDTEPNLPSIELANALVRHESVRISTPNWAMSSLTLSQTTVEPGNTPADATPIELNVTVWSNTTPGKAHYYSFETGPDTNAYAVLVTESTINNEMLPLITHMVDENDGCIGRPCDDEDITRAFTKILEPGTHIVRVKPHWEIEEPILYDIRVIRDDAYYQQYAACLAIETQFADPLYGCQSNLKNTTANGSPTNPPPPGSDINVEAAWAAGVMGEGANVLIVDKDLDHKHEDLKDNVDKLKNHDYHFPQGIPTGTNGRSLMDSRHGHGTVIAGIIAARDNSVGIRGVAPRATIYGHNGMKEPLAIWNVVDTVTRQQEYTAISNNSFHQGGGPTPIKLPQSWKEALDKAVKEGNHGKGVSYFFPGSTFGPTTMGNDTNLAGLLAHHGIISVCSLAQDGIRIPQSGTGFTNWICVPSRGQGTWKLNDGYAITASESPSWGTAVASGLGALIRSANPDLNWREVKLILAGSALKPDPSNSLWEDGAYHYRNDSKWYHYNPEYGFGVPDAGVAVNMAKDWTPLPQLRTNRKSNNEDITVSDAPANGDPTTHASSIDHKSKINFVEWVKIVIDFDHQASRDLHLTLTSPSGAVTNILDPFVSEMDTALQRKHTFASARHLGEDPNGTWTLNVTDRVHGKSGTIKGWTLVILGHQNEIAAGEPGISGDPKPGNTLQAHTTNISDADGLKGVSYSHQWFADGTPIAGATSSTYTVTADDEDKSITLQVSFTDDAGNPEKLTSQPAGIKRPAGLTATTSGQTLILNWLAPHDFEYLYDYVITRETPELDDSAPTVVDTDNDQTTYTDEDVQPGTLYVYTVKAANYFNRFSYESLSVQVRTPVWEIIENTPAVGQPAITGVTQVGLTLTADTTGITDADGLDNASYTYQWLADDSDVTGATGDTYVLTSDEAGKTIKVVVTFADDASNDETLSSDATTAVAPVPITRLSLIDTSDQTVVTTLSGNDQIRLEGSENGSYTIRADLAIGATLESVRMALTGAKTVDVTDNGPSYSLHGENGSSLNGQGLPAGSYNLVVTAYSDDDRSGILLQTLRASFSIIGANTPATGQPTISGNIRVGETLTTNTDSVADADGLAYATYSYQWLADDAAISGSTSRQHTITRDQEGVEIKVVVSFSDDAGNTETLTSAATAPVAPKVPAAPTNLNGAVNDDGAIVITWEAPQNDTVTGYQILRRRPRENEPNLLIHVADTGNASTTYTDTDTDLNTLYVYRVKAINSSGIGPQSNYANVERTLQLPAAPTNLTASTNGDGHVVLSWTAPDDGSVTGYHILRRRPRQSEDTLLTYVADTGSTATTYTDAEVATGELYVYRVKAVNGNGAGPQSNYANIEP